jgi:hypothetical protein
MNNVWVHFSLYIVAALAALVGIQFISLNILRPPQVVLQPGDGDLRRRNNGTTANKNSDDGDGADDDDDDDAIIFRGQLVKDHFGRKGEGNRFRPLVKVLHHRQVRVTVLPKCRCRCFVVCTTDSRCYLEVGRRHSPDTIRVHVRLHTN